jgi:uncharacterized phage protein gp47/JayE
MPFARPPRAQLIDEARSDLQSRLKGVDPFLRRTLVGAVGVALGGAMDGVYGYMDWAVKQIFAKSMDPAFVTRRGSLWNLSQEGPTAAQPIVGFTGQNGSDIPAETALVRSDGILYQTNADTVIAGGVASATITCQTPGSIGNLGVGQTLQFQQPLATVGNLATCSSVGLEGNDAETPAEFQARITTRQAQPPQGGNSNDYVEWAINSGLGATRAWPLPQWMGPGTVGLTFVMDNRANIVPLAGDVAAMQAYVNAKRPVRATLFVIAPNTQAIAVTAHLTPNTAATQAAAAAELADLFSRITNAGGMTVEAEQIRDAIFNAAGVTNVAMTAPAADTVIPAGTIAQLGAVTWD